MKGVAQCVQIESSLSNCKRKANEMEEDQSSFGRVFGIVTDAEKAKLQTIGTGGRCI